MSRKNENKCNYITIYKSNNMPSNKYKNTKNNIITNVKAIGYTACIAILASSSPAYADWFQVQNVKAALITPVFNMVNDNLGYISFAAGAGSAFLAKGMDGWQRGVAFGMGAFGTAGAVKLAQTVLHLG
jgi:hypothetical protein